MNIVLSGANGRMGKVIADLVAQRDDLQIVAGIDREATEHPFPIVSTPADLSVDGDCIIDFSHPSMLTPLLSLAKERHIPLVLATTGYSPEQIEEIHSASAEVPIFFSFNMSLGINLLAELCKQASAILGDEFDIEIVEKHHNQKLDAPSGTALLLANEINSVNQNRYEYEYNRASHREKRKSTEIGIHAVRGGTIVGEHEVIFAGPDEIITLSHSASSRQVFANGALRAGVFLANQPNGLYSMKDIVASL